MERKENRHSSQKWIGELRERGPLYVEREGPNIGKNLNLRQVEDCGNEEKTKEKKHLYRESRNHLEM